MREIKFRAWDGKHMKEPSVNMLIDSYNGGAYWQFGYDEPKPMDVTLMQYTGLHDKNGKEIYEGDILEFTDKWEWYRGSYGIKMMFATPEEKVQLKSKYDAEPMYRRTVQFDSLEGYGLSKNDLEYYFEVIGNIYEDTELLK